MMNQLTRRLFSSTSIRAVTRPITRPDPLKNASKFTLEDGSEFVVRPPPSSAEAYVDANSVVSPLLNNDTPRVDASNAPSLHSRKKTLNFNLSDAEINEIRNLRSEGHSGSSLAKRFNCSSAFVAMVAPATKSERQSQKSAQQAQKDAWGFNKKLSRAEREKRKEFW